MSGQTRSQRLVKKANNNERVLNEAVTQTCTVATAEQINTQMVLCHVSMHLQISGF